MESKVPTRSSDLLQQAREFTNLLFELRMLRVQHKSALPIETFHYQSEDGLYQVIYTNGFVCCLDQLFDTAITVEHKTPMRLIAYLTNDPHAMVVFSKAQPTSMLYLAQDTQITWDTLKGAQVTWDVLAEQSKSKDLMPWILAAQKLVLQSKAVVKDLIEETA
jgi:hypothetical protein